MVFFAFIYNKCRVLKARILDAQQCRKTRIIHKAADRDANQKERASKQEIFAKMLIGAKEHQEPHARAR